MPKRRAPPVNKIKSGRPTKYKKEYCEIVIDLMSQGASLASVATKLGVGRDTIYGWENQHPDFARACSAGKAAAQRFFEQLAMNVATGFNKLPDEKGKPNKYRFANHGLIMFLMARRFPDYYSKKEGIIEGENNNRMDFIKSLTADERRSLIIKYKQIICDLSEDVDQETL